MVSVRNVGQQQVLNFQVCSEPILLLSFLFNRQIKVLADFIKCTDLSFSSKPASSIGFIGTRYLFYFFFNPSG
jgi:hypothetical protein